MLSISRACPSSVGEPLSRKRSLSARPSVLGSERPVQPHLPPNFGDTAAASPLAKRFASLTVVQPPLTPESAASVEVCSAPCPVPEACAEQTFKEALTALATGGLCSPEHVAVLKNKYGSLELLMPYLGPTFRGVDDLPLSRKEWKAVVQAYPLAIARVPLVLLLEDDTLCVEALSASQGSAEVVSLLPKGHEQRLCREAFSQYPTLLGLLPVGERTFENCRAACIKKKEAMAHVPEPIQTEEFLHSVCADNPWCFRELPDTKKTKELAALACALRGELLKDVPMDLRDEALCKEACRKDPIAIEAVPEEILTESFCLHLVENGYRALRYIPKDKRTFKVCEAACANCPEDMEFVPDGLKTEGLCQKVLQNEYGFYAYPWLPSGLVSEKDCEKICELRGSNLQYVPDALKNEKLYRIATKHSYWELCTVREQDRTRDLCLKSGLSHKCNFTAVPNDYIDLKFLFSVMGGKNDLDLHTRAQKQLTEEDYTTFLCLSALHRTQTQLKLLTWPSLPERFRSRLINFLAGTGEPIALHRLPQHALINRHNPLRGEMYNPFVTNLLLQAHTARHYRPACQADGQAWLDYLEEQLPKYLDRPLPPIDNDLAKPLQTGHIEPIGGRTCLLYTSPSPRDRQKSRMPSSA